MKLLKVLMGLASLLAAEPASAAEITGLWASPRDGIVVEISQCGTASVCGRLVSSNEVRRNPAAMDSRNQVEALRRRPLRAVPVLWGFKAVGGRWAEGHIYNIEDGKTYDGTVEPVSSDVLKIKGCAASMLGLNFCGIQQWKRVKG